MASRDYFAHEGPDGTTVAERYDRAGYEWGQCAENILRRHPSSLSDAMTIAEDIVDDWMTSSSHRRNILKSDFEVEGIGVYYESDGSIYATQNFA